MRGLLAEQHPDLAERDLAIVANGWDNVIVRVGTDLVARLPRRELAAALVAHEQRWLPALATHLPIPVPVPLRVGVPGLGYPWAWSICDWFQGEVAADVPLADPAREADRLGAFVHALHRPAPVEAPRNPFRGQPVTGLVPRIRANLARLHLERTALDALVDELAKTSPWRGPAKWLHGDLHSANLLVDGGEIVAVLDFGDLTSGDPAVDLAVAWMLFQPEERRRFRSAAGGGTPVDEPTWDRARLWGLHFALIYVRHSYGNERFARMGERLLRAVTAGDTGGD
ncbi:aminoglycoside phosphotransferase family protein [Tessaracoccus rhinocerotis]|uniref:Aminoglycoside phosphotransferase family protein n=1 Tax=Tessaracoccus rhinocerotis TaxID=1689449 RepID=A0A553JYI4_9ACTN|nr:aminoglycoside phosphotransferase family protein [Tessaracoccus rhinocerotis]